MSAPRCTLLETNTGHVGPYVLVAQPRVHIRLCSSCNLTMLSIHPTVLALQSTSKFAVLAFLVQVNEVIDADISSEIKIKAQYLRLKSHSYSDATLQAAHVHILPLFRLMGYDSRFQYDVRVMLVWAWIMCYREASRRCWERAQRQELLDQKKPSSMEELMADCLSLTEAYHLSRSLTDEYDLLRFDRPFSDEQVRPHLPPYESASGKIGRR